MLDLASLAVVWAPRIQKFCNCAIKCNSMQWFYRIFIYKCARNKWHTNYKLRIQVKAFFGPQWFGHIPGSQAARPICPRSGFGNLIPGSTNLDRHNNPCSSVIFKLYIVKGNMQDTCILLSGICSTTTNLTITANKQPSTPLTKIIPYSGDTVTCHLSCVTCHMSPVTCCLSPVICHLSSVTYH